ncbi:MAG: cyclic diguanylate phosphodiesterase [Nevskia sp.]|nr:cyclic diguanylate phosphodiesterase [Nevskia sp.]
MATIVMGLLPLLLLTGISYWQAVHDADNRRHAYAGLALDRAERIFSSADALLRSLATQIDPQCDAKTQAALSKAAYDGLYFRGAGVIRNGVLQCTDESVLDPPVALRRPDQLPAPSAPIVIAAPGALLPGDPSIVALYSVQKDLALALLINPAQFSEALQPLIDTQQVAVLILGADNVRLTQFGWRFDMQPGTPRGVQSTSLVSRRFPIQVVATTARSWMLQAWKHSAPLYASVGLAISGLLFFLGNKLVLRQFSMDAELRDALTNDEFQVYYQPVIDIHSGACVGAEALLRWQHPQRGLVMPDVFFAIAEKTGFAVPLTAWVMERVADEMGSLLAANPGFHISLNLSARHILDPSLLETIRKTFRDGVPPQRIIFEITEQELLRGDHDALLAVVQHLRDTGARLALDDFGTGYSSLKYLTQFRFDYLKIDKVFIQAIGIDKVTAGLVDVIVDIAKRLQLQVIAEGVETTEQLDYIRQLDVRLVQGWLFSKALPAPLFRQYTNRRQAELDTRPRSDSRL